jgi:hypothetical protein
MEDSISQGRSVLVRDKDGWPVFSGTKADLRYITPATTREEADKETIKTFLYMIEKNRKSAIKILDHYIKTTI